MLGRVPDEALPAAAGHRVGELGGAPATISTPMNRMLTDGPTGGHKLTATTFIQRLNTSGGKAPSTSCTVGEKQLVPYTADYFFFYKADESN